MQQPNYTDNQFVNGALLNQGQSYIAASLKDLGASLFTAGLFYPNDLTYTLNSLSVSVSAGTSFRLLDGEGNLCGFYGTTNGQTSSSVTVDFSSLVPSSGSVTAYLVATRYALSQNSTAVIGPPIGHPDYNPSNAPFLWYTETEDSLYVYATTTAPDNISVFELFRTTFTAGQTSITSYSTANIKYAQPQQSVVPYAGNPNGKVAGVQGGNGISPTIVWDTNDNILWFCTTTGTASSAVWQGLAPLTGNSNYAFNVANATTSTEAVNLGQAQADFAALNGSSSEAFNVANATTSTEAVNLGQAQADFAALNGSSSEAFNVANATTATEAVQLQQLFKAYYPSASATGTGITASVSFTVSQNSTILVNANAGVTAGVLTGLSITGSGYSTQGGTGNYGTTSVGAINEGLTATAGSSVTINLNATSSQSATVSIGGTVLVLPQV